MYTETTDTTVSTVYFDGNCGLCANWAHRASRALPPDRFRFMPISTLDPPHDRDEMVVESGGRRLGGADAMVALMPHVWWLRPIGAIARLPGVMFLLRSLYPKLAANRYRLARVCRYPVPDNVESSGRRS